MGWAGGSRLFNRVWGIVRVHVPEEQREEVASKVIGEFVKDDWDTLDEIDDNFPEKNGALVLHDPEWFDPDDWGLSEEEP